MLVRPADEIEPSITAALARVAIELEEVTSTLKRLELLLQLIASAAEAKPSP